MSEGPDGARGTESGSVASGPPVSLDSSSQPPVGRRISSSSASQWYSLERVKRAVLDSGGHRLGMLSPGTQFGVYLVGPCIGEGGMARVYQAEHAGLRRQVALKVLVDGFARHPDGRERFLREARIAAAIKHPNVVNIFDVGVHEDIPYLVMELLEGQDLERLIGARGALPESLIVDIMVPVVAGLIAVHDAGIVHRDLKPGNIFLARGRYYDLEPKLLDFGISKAPGPDVLKLTTSRTVMGTPLYVSPEGLRGGEMTPLSDQYSLGVMMYECATGKMPFPASNFPELSNLIAAGRYTPPGRHKPALSKRMAVIIERAMSLDPARRFRDLRELGRELLQLAGQRTRITWGLSFGDKSTLSSTPGAHALDGTLAPRPAMSRGRKAVAFTALALFGVAQVALLGSGISAWLSGRFTLLGGARALLSAPARLASRASESDPGPPVALAPGPAEVTVLGASGDRAPPSAATAANALGVAHGLPPAPAAAGVAGDAVHPPTADGTAAAASPNGFPSAAASAGRRDARPTPGPSIPAVAAAHAVPTPAASGAATAPVDRRRTAGASDDGEPEWALPAPSGSAPSQTPPHSASQGSGANGAPILD